MEQAPPGSWSSFAQAIIETSTSPIVVFDSSGVVAFANDAACQMLGPGSSGLIGKSAEDRVFGVPESPFALHEDSVPESPFALVRRTKEPARGLRYAVSPLRGGLKRVLVDAAPLWTEARGLAGVAITYTDQTAETAAADDFEWMRREIDAHRVDADGLLRMTERLNVISGLVLSDNMVEKALAEAREAADADGAAVVYRTGGGPYVTRGSGCLGDVADDIEPTEGSVARSVMEHDETIAVDDAANDQRTSALAEKYGVKAMVVSPMHVETTALGVIYLTHRDVHHFTAAEIQFATRFGHLLSLLIENARLIADLNERDKLNAEYARIAEFLHSTLDPDEVARTALEEGRSVLGAQSAAIALRVEGGIRTSFESGWRGASVVGRFLPSEQDPHGSLATAEKRLVAIDDAFNDERMSQTLAEEYGLKSVIVAPLAMRGDVFATLYFNYHDAPHSFSQAEIAFVERLASSLSLALDNARLFESEAELLHDTGVAQRLLSIAAARTDLHSLANEILKMLEEELGIAHGSVYAYDPEEQALNAIGFHNYPDSAVESIRHVTLDQDIPAVRMIRERLPYVTNRAVSLSETAVRLFRALGIEGQRWISLALRVGEQVVGTLGLTFDGDRPFTKSEIRLYRLVANQLAIAFEKTRLFEAESDARSLAAQELASSTALLRVSFLLSQYTSAADVTAALAEAFLSATQHTRVAVWLTGETPDELVLAAAAGERTPVPGTVMHIPQAVTHPESSDAAWRSELLEPQESVHLQLGPDDAPQLGLLLPLVRGSEMLGYVTVDSPGLSASFDVRERELLEAAVAQGAIALANARLLEREREASSLNDALRRANEMLLSTTDLRETLPRVLEAASAAVSADMTLLATDDGGSWLITSAVGFDADLMGRRFSRPTANVLTSAAEAEEPLFITDAQDEARAGAAFARRVSMQSYMALPLRGRHFPNGVAAIGFRQRRSFGPNDRVFAQRFTSSMTLALENAALLQERVVEARLNRELGRIQGEILAVHEEDAVWTTSLAQLCDTLACSGVAIVRYDTDEPAVRFVIGELNAESTRLRDAFDSAEYQDKRTTSWAESGRAKTRELDEAEVTTTHSLLVALPKSDVEAGLLLQRQSAFSRQEVGFARRLASTLETAAQDARLLKEREELALAREEWLSGVSHDLRTPLAAVRGYAQLLASDYETPPEEVRRESSLILDQADRIERLIEDMSLTFRIRAGALPLNMVDTDVHEVLEEVACTLAAYEGVSAEHVSVLPVSAADPVCAYVDPELLERVLMNLGRNAVVHNPQGTIVRFAARNNEGSAVVTVSDDGAGMDEELLARIFVPYERGSATGGGAAGTGLGMSITRQLIEAMHGSLEVDSELGRGTTVTLRLPTVE